MLIVHQAVCLSVCENPMYNLAQMLMYFKIELYSANIVHSVFYFVDRTDMDDGYILRKHSSCLYRNDSRQCPTDRERHFVVALQVSTTYLMGYLYCDVMPGTQCH